MSALVRTSRSGFTMLTDLEKLTWPFSSISVGGNVGTTGRRTVTGESLSWRARRTLAHRGRSERTVATEWTLNSASA